MKLVRLFFAALVGWSQSSSAQSSQAAPLRECSETLLPVDTARVVFELHAEERRVWRMVPSAGLSVDYLTSVAAAVGWNLSLPAVAPTNVFGSMDGKGALPGVAWRSISSAVVFTLKKDGQIADVNVHGPGGSSVMEQALAHAVIRAHSAGELPRLPAGLTGKDVTLEVSIAERVQDEAVPDTLAHIPVHDGASRRVVVGAGLVERYRLDQIVRPHMRTQEVPFPREGVRASVGDSVLMVFIVDENGRVETGSAMVVSAKYREFARAVLEDMPRMRFEPARSGTCPLRTVVHQAFVFRIAP